MSCSLIDYSNIIPKVNDSLYRYTLEFQQEQQLILVNKFQDKLNHVKQHLNSCGEIIKREWYCKKCECENLSSLLRVDKPTRLDCQMRYCSNPLCVNTRFARIFEILNNTPRLRGLNKMFHFTIGFPKININNFTQEVKNQRRNINSYFSKLRKNGVHFNGFQVLDISKGSDDGPSWDGKYYVHYHIIAIPPKNQDTRSVMVQMKKVEKEMKVKQKISCPFFVKIHGTKHKQSLFSYLSIRSIGLYKSNERKEKFYNPTAKLLTESIKNGKFMFLNQIVNLEQYVSLFYNRRMFSVIGKEIKLPKGSIILDNVVCKYPNECHIHGHLNRSEVRMVIVRPQDTGPPPDSNETTKMVLDIVSPNFIKTGEMIC